MTTRRTFLGKSSRLLTASLAALGLAGTVSDAQTQPPEVSKKKLHILMRSSWGTDEPTRASFVFSHGVALAEASHEVQIFLTHDATYLMRKATVDAIKPIGWPALSETMAKVVARHIAVFA